MKIINHIIFLILATTILYSAEYHVDKSNKNLVRFISETPIENFDGKTDKIDGYLVVVNQDNLSNSELYFETEVGTFDTGIGLRNRHMREDYLHTDKYPLSHFTGKITDSKQLSETEFDITAAGKLYLHGVTKDVKISGKIYKLKDGFKLKSDFTVKLPDYKIKVPKFMFVRISEEIKLQLDFNVKLAE
ncbi:MAG: YceI family protein [Candidatus Kapaibacterium sp.]